jgi:3-phosphoshikimate 1-carboxyvinyltransferase
MTLEALRKFGIGIYEQDNDIFNVSGNQTGRSPGDIHVEGDWSNAAFWLCLGAIGSAGVTCAGLDLDSAQGDKAVVDILKKFGAKVICGNGSVTVCPDKLIGIEIDASDTPDLVPILAAAASVAEGKTVIYNAGRLRNKESDRLKAVAESLSGLGADITETEDGLIITGKTKLTGGETESFGDHRIAMTAAIVSAVCENPVTIRGAETVRKSYPGFFEHFKTAFGGELEIEI